jgi:hypothetical protein
VSHAQTSFVFACFVLPGAVAACNKKAEETADAPLAVEQARR